MGPTVPPAICEIVRDFRIQYGVFRTEKTDGHGIVLRTVLIFSPKATTPPTRRSLSSGKSRNFL